LDGDGRATLGVDTATTHAFGIEGHGEIAGGVPCDVAAKIIGSRAGCDICHVSARDRRRCRSAGATPAWTRVLPPFIQQGLHLFLLCVTGVPAYPVQMK
jgi:hypothetical protein